MPDPTPLGRTPDDDRSDEPLEADPVIRSALASHFGEPPAGAVDWTALEARVTDAARFRLAQRARRGGWRAAAERWWRFAIPAGIAATLLLAAGLALSAPDPIESGAIAIDELVAVVASDALPDDPLGFADQDAFLAAVLDSTE